MKINCDKCGLKATWCYAPLGSIYFCEDHVPRGCSCNILSSDDSEDIVELRDDRGRLLPCCEYDYDEDGFEKPEDPDDKYDVISEKFEER